VVIDRRYSFVGADLTSQPPFVLCRSDVIVFMLAWIGTACWITCFWWMHPKVNVIEGQVQDVADAVASDERKTGA
jgi:hypothetical protein